nr:MAG: internal scaffolding protein [Microvirus sp.]
MKNSKETIDMETGEILSESIEKLNEVIFIEERRPDGSLRYAMDFKNCPTMAEQHTAHLTNINYLMERYKPDELAQYLAARNQHRQEIIGHDFSSEPSLQEGRNFVYQSRQAFEQLPEEIKNNFKSHLEFLKFIDNPNNVQKMLKLGILTETEIQKIQIPDPNQVPNLEPNQQPDPKSTKSTKSQTQT